MMEKSLAIQTFDLTRKFRHLIAVDGINLQIGEGELFSLLGPNGAGKTTAISMLCCLLKPTSGTASVLGYDIVKEPYKVKDIIGVSPQETVISEHLNCWENLSLIGKVHGLGSKELRERSQELLETVGLLERAKDQVRKFSGGMKRRLSLMMSLIHDPKVLFLDEPTLGLDPQSRRALWEYMAQIKGKKTILLTTHYMEEADFLSDRIAIIDDGKIVALGTSEELKNSISEKQTMVISATGITAEVVEGLRRRDLEVEQRNEGLEVSAKALKFKDIVEYLQSQNVDINSVAFKEPTLEDVFLSITGKELRE